MKYNLDELHFEKDVVVENNSDLFNVLSAKFPDSDINEPDVIVGYDLNTQKSSIAVKDGSQWFDSLSTGDWGILDSFFGRVKWQEFVSYHQVESDEML